MARYDLKTPCKNCPFRNDETRIRFATRGRADEIQEHAYRQGFPCHLSADLAEVRYGEEEGYVFGRNTQHCVGYIIMALKENDGMGGGWPGIDNDDDLAERLMQHVDMDAPVFDTVEDFLDANTAEGETVDG